MPALHLNGAEFDRFGAALRSAFPVPDELTRLLRVKLDKSITDLTSLLLPYSQVTDNVISRAEAQGWSAELLDAAREENPGNEALQAFAARLESARTTAAAVAEPIGPPLRRPASGTQAPVAPDAQPSSVHGFLSVAGIEETAALAVATCVVLEDPEPLRRALTAAREDVLHDPILRAAPEVAALRNRIFDFAHDDPDVRTRVLETLAVESFEAYVWFGRRQAVGENNDPFDRLIRGLLRDRLSSDRSRRFELLFDPLLAPWSARVGAAVRSAVVEIRRSDKRGVAEPAVGSADRKELCIAAAAYVSALVAVRLTGTDTVQRRLFDRLHPNKIRLIHELGTRQFYKSNNPLR